ncbi:hypothetical protein [Rhodococcoides fascians]|uniref:hypothetical protein n=1 Tax=Rhodococcoides fascians TaxID=1828 RepID=UPI00050CB4A7|nr:hypothetical protein [Rhodococcus fascians]
MSNTTAHAANEETRRIVIALAVLALIALFAAMALTEINSLVLLPIAAVVLLPAQIYLNKNRTKDK